MTFTGPLFYVTEKDGAIVHQPREVAEGALLHGSGHTITASSIKELEVEVKNRELSMPRLPWRAGIRQVWQSAPEGISDDPIILQLALAIGELKNLQQIRAVIRVAREANKSNVGLVELADSLLDAAQE
jgi:hypothetical protein